MAAYKYLNALWRKKQSEVMHYLLRIRSWHYRQQKAIVRVTKPSRPEKARRLGYKCHQGYVIYRIRVRRGGRKRDALHGISYGKPTNIGIRKQKRTRNFQSFAEERAGRACGSLRVLSSYWVGKDGTYVWYEVIMVDPRASAIRNDPSINWICNPVHKHRENHGLTSAGRKARGLHRKGLGVAKMRPSKHAVWKRHNTVRLARKR